MTLTTLLPRLEAGEASRELDELIARDVAGMPATMLLGHECLGTDRVVPRHAPPYTKSLDAALALAERVLPGWRVSVTHERHGEWSAFLISEACDTAKAYAPAPALALCLAIVKAKLWEVG